MSNIGKQRILIPKNVKIKCIGWKLYISGKNGQTVINFPAHTQFILKDNYLQIKGSCLPPALYGSLQRKLKNLIYGFSLKYVSYLQFVGIGYRPRIENNEIILRLGFSHEISLSIPLNLEVNLVKRDLIKIVGINFEEVRHFAFKIRSYRPPEPFKGKGIICLGETVRRKEGKKKKI